MKQNSSYGHTRHTIIGMLIGILIASVLIFILDYSSQLGDSICKERDLGKFVSFDKSDKVLICEPNPSEQMYQMYDGIRIKINNGG